jgi:hypothetical protein
MVEYSYNDAIEGAVEASEKVDPEKYYAPAGVVTARTVLGTSIDTSNIDADGTDKATISSVPAGTEVFVDYLYNEECNDGSIEILSDDVGRIYVELFNFPYKKKVYTIYAN